jgi:Uncharacterized protein conserved in cyanobacteria
MKSGNKRWPDISFMAKERLQGLDELPDRFLEGGPDLGVEILSPGNTVAEIHDKLVEYFDNGARLVWVIHPKERYVLVYRSFQEPDRLLKSTYSLDGEEIVSGFTLPVAEFFQKLAFSGKCDRYCDRQSTGIGCALLRDVIIRTLQGAEIAGIRAIIVYGISEDFVKLFCVKLYQDMI